MTLEARNLEPRSRGLHGRLNSFFLFNDGVFEVFKNTRDNCLGELRLIRSPISSSHLPLFRLVCVKLFRHFAQSGTVYLNAFTLHARED